MKRQGKESGLSQSNHFTLEVEGQEPHIPSYASLSNKETAKRADFLVKRTSVILSVEHSYPRRRSHIVSW